MATTQIPPGTSQDPKPKKIPASALAEYGLHEIPVALLELKDELERSRIREAFWISVIVHLLIVFALTTSPKWVPGWRHQIAVLTPRDLMSQNPTFLELPQDLQKVEKRPDTNIISDKDRIATSRSPQLNRKELQKILGGRPGPPGPPLPQQRPGGMQAPPSPQVAQAQPPAPQQGQQQPSQGRPGPVAPQQNQSASLENVPPIGGGSQANRNNPFSAAMSPGSVIQQAARASASTRGVGGGAGGDYGMGQGRRGASVQSNVEILSDTRGVDFGPYLERVVQTVRMNWYNVIPEVALPPLLKRGRVTIEFAILKDGKVAGMRIVGPSGDVSLDRAAWGGITASNPFAPLPSQFSGQYLALRFRFYYNPNKQDMNEMQ